MTTSVAADPLPAVGVGIAVGSQASNVSSAERSMTSADSLKIMEDILPPLGIIAYSRGQHQPESTDNGRVAAGWIDKKVLLGF